MNFFIICIVIFLLPEPVYSFGLGPGSVLIKKLPQKVSLIELKDIQNTSNPQGTSIKIIVQESYPRYTSELSKGYIEYHAQQAIENAGFQVLENQDEKPDFILKIRIEGKALCKYYEGYGNSCEGAVINGEIALWKLENVLRMREFRGEKYSPGLLFLRSEKQMPLSDYEAPFSRARENAEFENHLTSLLQDLKDSIP